MKQQNTTFRGTLGCLGSTELMMKTWNENTETHRGSPPTSDLNMNVNIQKRGSDVFTCSPRQTRLQTKKAAD